MDTNVKNFEFTSGLKKVSLVLIAIGALATFMSFSQNKTVAWVDYLVNNIYFITVSVSGVFFLGVTGVLQASWITPYKRITEAMTKYLPYGFVLMLFVYFGTHTLYEWTHTELVANDPILREKTAWLNLPRFMVTMVCIFTAWIFVGNRLTGLSRKQDEGIDVNHKIVGSSAIGIILFALAICLAAFDWIMSIEPHWFSTIFGVYIFAGTFVSGMAFTTLIAIKLKENGYLKGILNENHFHDMGKWMFGFSTFWAYIWISQYLLIWYANIPEETEYYVLRHEHWNVVFFVNLLLNWAIPFFALMPREAKRNTKRLKTVAMILLVGHFVDLYLMVAPKVFHHHDIHHVGGYGVLQILQWLGYLGLFIFVVGKALSKGNIIPKGDPQLQEGVHLHQ